MIRDPRPTPLSAAVDFLAVLCVLGTIALLAGCASGPQLAAPVTPQDVHLTLDASDGGTITITHSEIWLDARGGDATADQHGLDVEADVDAEVSTQVHP